MSSSLPQDPPRDPRDDPDTCQPPLFPLMEASRGVTWADFQHKVREANVTDDWESVARLFTSLNEECDCDDDTSEACDACQ